VISLLRYLIAGGILLIPVGSIASDAVPPGLVEGHLKILSLNPVELAGKPVSKVAAVTYAEYPLIILSKDEKKEITRVTADREGNYRVTLPPGDYILDVQRRAPKRVRARPQPFTVVSGQTVRVDMDIDTGIR
jgi:hypothetical protein